jgi:hypothetical protein
MEDPLAHFMAASIYVTHWCCKTMQCALSFIGMPCHIRQYLLLYHNHAGNK